MRMIATMRYVLQLIFENMWKVPPGRMCVSSRVGGVKCPYVTPTFISRTDHCPCVDRWHRQRLIVSLPGLACRKAPQTLPYAYAKPNAYAYASGAVSPSMSSTLCLFDGMPMSMPIYGAVSRAKCSSTICLCP